MSKSVAPKVESLLKEFPSLRSSDKELLMAYWSEEGLELSDEQRRVFMRCTTAESITRARRALRMKYPGSVTAERERYTKYIETRDEYGMPIMIIQE
jgi:hypothetical protein